MNTDFLDRLGDEIDPGAARERVRVARALGTDRKSVV